MAPTTRRVAVLLAFAGLTSPIVVAAQRGSNTPDDTGARLYRTYCATCHGTGGRGDGPMADQLRTAPADLTGFAARNGGVFPSERLRAIIDGRGIRAHGIEDMPVWGDAFRSAPEGLSAREALMRIDAIVSFLRSMQVRIAQTGPPPPIATAWNRAPL
jgi:mono/diheme cytochrome c family protein